MTLSLFAVGGGQRDGDFPRVCDGRTDPAVLQFRHGRSPLLWGEYGASVGQLSPYPISLLAFV